LESFKQDLKTAPVERSVESEEAADKEDDLTEGNDLDWKSNVLKFQKVPKVRDPLAKKEEEYTTFDPLKLKNVPSISMHQRKLQAQKKDEKW
jgi:hypothetical protein